MYSACICFYMVPDALCSICLCGTVDVINDLYTTISTGRVIAISNIIPGQVVPDSRRVMGHASSLGSGTVHSTLEDTVIMPDVRRLSYGWSGTYRVEFDAQ